MLALSHRATLATRFSDVSNDPDQLIDDNMVSDDAEGQKHMTDMAVAGRKRAILEHFLALIWIRSKKTKVMVNDHIDWLF